MTAATTPTPGTSTSQVLEAVRRNRETSLRVAIEQLVLVREWALLHPCTPGESPADYSDVLCGDGPVGLAGPGAPQVSFFAVLELGAALGLSKDATRELVGDVLELTRLPRLWDHVLAGRVEGWRARAISQHTRDLSPDAALYADRLISAVPRKIGLVNAAKLVQEARLYFEPDHAHEDERRALNSRKVQLVRGPQCAPGVTDVAMTLDTADAMLLDQTLNRLAGDLKAFGDTDDLDVRRAKAVGILADPQHALDLLSGRDTEVKPKAPAGMILHVHTTPEALTNDLNGQVGGVVIEKLGPATTDLLHDWITRITNSGGTITMRPVISLGGNHTQHIRSAEPQPVDRHDPPQTMRETAFLRDAHCVFPACGRDSRTADLDHITKYVAQEDGGPPGQTGLHNLAPLCRSHHRLKTHTHWAYKRLDDGHHVWTTPDGTQHTVAPLTRAPLGH